MKCNAKCVLCILSATHYIIYMYVAKKNGPLLPTTQSHYANT